MAADGVRHGRSATGDSNPIVWSQDPTVLSYQKLANGYGPKDAPTIADRLFVRLPWHRETEAALARAMAMPEPARIEHCVRNEGPSRGSKTSVLRDLIRKSMPTRDEDGLRIPFGYLRVPAIPSVASLGQGVLKALGDPSWNQRRGPVERLSRIGELTQMVGLKAFGLDDVHHIVDSRGERVQHTSADFLIDLGTEMRVPFVYCGIERMEAMFTANEQLRGRTGALIEYPRLRWEDSKHKQIFQDAVEVAIAKFVSVLGADIDPTGGKLVFRLYCSTGGLIGYLFLILRAAEVECRRKRSQLNEGILRKAVAFVVAKPHQWPNGRDPFHTDFVAFDTPESLAAARFVGIGTGPKAK